MPTMVSESKKMHENSNQNLNENTGRHLKGTEDEVDTVGDEERGRIDSNKLKSFFKKTPSLDKLKSVVGKNGDLSKMEIPAGQTIDLTKLKTTSGQQIDLTKMKSFSRTKSDISKMEKMVANDPNLRSISSVVGKNPTELSAKQVAGVQSFVAKHPEESLTIVEKVLGGAFAAFFLLMAAGLITVVATSTYRPR